MRLVVEDLGSDFIQLLVDIAYHIPLHDLVGPHNVTDVLDLSEKLKLSQLRSHCVEVLERNVQPESCIGSYHLASRRSCDYLTTKAFCYFVRNFDQVWKKNTEFEALTPEELRTILEDDRVHAPSQVEDTFNALLKYRLLHATSAYAAEVVAFTEALKHVSAERYTGRVAIYTDCLSLLQVTASTQNAEPHVMEIRRVLNTIRRRSPIHLYHCLVTLGFMGTRSQTTCPNGRLSSAFSAAYPRRSESSGASFARNYYVYNPVLGKALGVPQKGLLTRSAVPSLLAPSFPPQVPSQEQTSVSAAIAESAIEGDAAGVPVETQTGSIGSAFQDGVAETERSQDEETLRLLEATKSTSGLQGQKDPARCPPSGTTGRSIGIDKSVQVHVRGISVGVQVNLTIKEKKDEGVQVDIDGVPLTSTPVKRQQQISPETSYVASPNLSPVRTCVDTTGSTYQPDESSWTLDSTLDEDDE
ncbi:hypothetical protein HPB52_022451 [Rhipicephalus sanguineus]|uniref:BACK domain-containing protein n=1 Tax=Rhipicephalus sanguineus TaxID=34632 RepID=A0A9D4Q309_RHISA|nr:hypothetical protein HPB52_022451 [Rhipicephalus sanguineus]